MNQSEIKLEDLHIVCALVMEVFGEGASLTSVVNGFHGLLETDGNEDAKDDDEEMDEEFAACRDAVLRRMDIDHRGGFLHRDFSWLLTHDFRRIKAGWRLGGKQRRGDRDRSASRLQVRWGLALSCVDLDCGTGGYESIASRKSAATCQLLPKSPMRLPAPD